MQPIRRMMSMAAGDPGPAAREAREPPRAAPEGAPAGALSPEQIDAVLRRGVIGRLGCHAGGRTYVVPMGYAYDSRRLYLRSGEGLKVQMLRENPSVCFQVDHIRDLANWESVLVFGEFRELRGPEAVEAMGRILDRLTSLSSDRDAWPRPATSSANDRIGHRAFSGGRSAVVGVIEPVEVTGRFERR